MADSLPEIVVVERRLDPLEVARLTRIADPAIRDRVQEITFELIGEGDPLP